MSRLGYLITVSRFALHDAGIPMMVGAGFVGLANLHRLLIRMSLSVKGLRSQERMPLPLKFPTPQKQQGG